jgi:hypothetical protein
VIDNLDSLEQTDIKDNGICRSGKLRLPLAFERLILRRRHVFPRDAEHAHHAIERAPR